MLNGFQWVFYSRAFLSCSLNTHKYLGSTENSTAQIGNILRNIIVLFCFIWFNFLSFCFTLFCYGLFCLYLNLPPVNLGQFAYNRCLNLSKQNFLLNVFKRQLSWWFDEFNSELLLCFMPKTEIKARCLCQGASVTARIIYHLCVIFCTLRAERVVLMSYAFSVHVKGKRNAYVGVLLWLSSQGTIRSKSLLKNMYAECSVLFSELM